MAQDRPVIEDYHFSMTKRLLIPGLAFLLGIALIAGFYLGVLAWAEGWDYAASQFARDRWYVLPIISGFGIQAALYSVLRFRLFIPLRAAAQGGAILGLSAAATFLTRYQKPFMLVGLAMNITGTLVMLAVL